MATLTWEAFQEQYAIARAAKLEILGMFGNNTYVVSSRRPNKEHKVWTVGHTTNCSCELSALGNKPCPHGALAFIWAAWQRAEVRP